MVITGCIFFVIFFNAVIYPDVEIKGFSNISSCTDECYEEYVNINGTAPQIEKRKKEIASADEFSSIKPLWAGCAACHGQEGGGGVGGSNLKELLPKRATWTKLDFHGASVEDERRTKRSKNSDSSTFNTGQYSELKALLPKRTINWKKGQLLSSGSSPTVTENFRGLREERSFGVKEERQLVMKNDVIASAALSSSDGEDVGVIDDNIDDEEEEEVVKPYQNLRDLLPQRRVTWKGK